MAPAINKPPTIRFVIVGGSLISFAAVLLIGYREPLFLCVGNSLAAFDFMKRSTNACLVSPFFGVGSGMADSTSFCRFSCLIALLLERQRPLFILALFQKIIRGLAFLGCSLRHDVLL